KELTTDRRSLLMSDRLDIVVVTGLAGSGKSVAIRSLEDRGFFCIDNLPVRLIPQFVELCQGSGEGIARIALGVDLRASQFLQSWPAWRRIPARDGHPGEVVSPAAPDEVLLRRFSETPRPHPLAGNLPVQEAIALERKALEGMRALADKVIDTSLLNVHELKREIDEQFSQSADMRRMELSLPSFGDNDGNPPDAPIIMAVRL